STSRPALTCSSANCRATARYCATCLGVNFPSAVPRPTVCCNRPRNTGAVAVAVAVAVNSWTVTVATACGGPTGVTGGGTNATPPAVATLAGTGPTDGTATTPYCTASRTSSACRWLTIANRPPARGYTPSVLSNHSRCRTRATDSSTAADNPC